LSRVSVPAGDAAVLVLHTGFDSGIGFDVHLDCEDGGGSVGMLNTVLTALEVDNVVLNP
jgi:hypothetical protein